MRVSVMILSQSQESKCKFMEKVKNARSSILYNVLTWLVLCTCIYTWNLPLNILLNTCFKYISTQLLVYHQNVDHMQGSIFNWIIHWTNISAKSIYSRWKHYTLDNIKLSVTGGLDNYTYFLSMWVKRPSVHSLVLGSMLPYRASLEMDWNKFILSKPYLPPQTCTHLNAWTINFKHFPNFNISHKWLDWIVPNFLTSI